MPIKIPSIKTTQKYLRAFVKEPFFKHLSNICSIEKCYECGKRVVVVGFPTDGQVVMCPGCQTARSMYVSPCYVCLNKGNYGFCSTCSICARRHPVPKVTSKFKRDPSKTFLFQEILITPKLEES